MEQEGADVVCLQETKLQDDAAMCSAAAADLGLEGWSVHWSCSTVKKGYSGVALLSRVKPRSVRKGIDDAAHEGEGRVLTAEFDDFFVVSVSGRGGGGGGWGVPTGAQLCTAGLTCAPPHQCYVPNSGEKCKRLDYRVKEWDVGEPGGGGGGGGRVPAPPRHPAHPPPSRCRRAGATPQRLPRT